VFWKKKKEIVLNCYTNRAEVYNFFPVVQAKKAIPKWFKDIPAPKFKEIEDQNLKNHNLKLCPAFIDYFKNGISMPLWSDLFIRIGAKNTLDYRWQYSDKRSDIEYHSPEQINNHFDPLFYQHLKITSPWLFSCEEDISFLAVEPGWQFDVLNTARILSGVISFKYQSETNINMFITRGEKETDLLFPAGMPIYHYFPLTERKVTIKNHLVSDKEFKNLKAKGFPFKFAKDYEARKKIIGNMQCPYKHETTK